MAMSRRLYLALMAMDAYSRSSPDTANVNAINGLPTSLGLAVLLNVPLPDGSYKAGFAGAAYSYDGKLVVSYRGTDKNTVTSGGDGSDLLNGYGLGAGSGAAPQALLAIEFAKSAVKAFSHGTTDDPRSISMIATGHSLGGGLAGYVAGLYSQSATVFDNMAFQNGVLSAYHNATSENDLNNYSLELRNRIYGNATPSAPSFAQIDAVSVRGQFLAINSGFQDIPEALLESHSDLGIGQLHSMALATALVWAAENTGTNWVAAGKYLWDAYFDDDIALKVPGAGDRTGALDRSSAGDTLRAAIAYSAISEGERPFGDTGIVAMFDDAADLGNVLSLNDVSGTVKASAKALAQAFVEFAAKLSLGDVEGGQSNPLTSGILALSQDGKTLAANFSTDRWSYGASHTSIVGRDTLITKALSTVRDDKSQASDLTTGMTWLWGSPTTSIIDRVEFATTNAATARTLPASGNIGQSVTLFAAGDGADTITGSADDEIIAGGLGSDRIYGGAGNDLIVGGGGDDILSGGAGRDFIAGGDGFDTIDLGLDSRSSGATLTLRGIEGADQTQRGSFEYSESGDTDRAIGVERMVLTGYSDKLIIKDLGDMDGDRPMSELTIDFGGAQKGRAAGELYHLNDDLLDLSGVGRTVTSPGLLGSSTNKFGVVVDLRNFSDQTVQYLRNGAFLSDLFPGMFGRSDVMLKTANANSVVGTQYDDVLYGENGKEGTGEGYSTLYGGAGNDYLVGAGWESHLYGGSGADQFSIGANTFIEDSPSDDGDTSYYLGFRLTGGVNQWWMESGYAAWSPFSSLTAAFPVIGAELLYTAAMFVDAVTMKFVRYRMASDGTLEMNFGWGQAGQAALRNYNIDLDTGKASGGIAVFSAQRTSGKGNTLGRIENFVNLALYAGFGHGLNGVDPLVLDLDGDGYQLTTEVNSQVWFDYNRNGFAQHTGWVGGADGFLVRDVNGNGRIDDLSEMFGNATKSGFDMLAGFDTNHDGSITAADAVYATLKVWQDKNQNGVTDSGELKSLADLGIVAIGLASSTPSSLTTIGGNQIVREGNFTLASGVTHKIADVVFDASATNTRYLGDTTVSAAAGALPQLTGFGTIKDLRVAMTQNATLREQVSSFVANSGVDLPGLKRGAESIVYAWAGVASVAATAIGGNGFDARKLAFLEMYSGASLMPRNSDGTLNLDNLGQMEALWADTITRLTLRLAVQGPKAAAFAEITYRPDLDLLVANGPTALADILHRIVAALPASDHSGAVAQWASWAPLLGALTDSMVRSDAMTVRVDFLFQQLLRASDGVTQPLSIAELAAGLGISNLQLGTSGADTLSRVGGDTAVYYGLGGDDIFNGGGGQDVYVFGRKIGHVVINDIEAKPAGDRIRFAFLSASDVTLGRDGDDLLITVKATSETIRVTGQFAPVVPRGADLLLSPDKGVEDIQFADGSIWEIPEIMAAVGMGTAGDDHLIGSMHSDVMTGGRGNDLMEGGDDADLYVINAGDGQDTIHEVQTTPLLRSADMVVFGDGLAPEDLVMARVGENGNDLLFTFKGSTQSLLIQDQFGYSVLGYNAAFALNSRIEVFAFRDYANGWSIRDIQQKLIAQSSTSGNDTILGFGDDDVIDGGAGNDTLVGFDGQDTYMWGNGDGNDTIDERAQYIDVSVGLGGLSLTASADTISFKGLNRDSLIFTRPNADPDLLITNKITGETLTVRGQFAGFQTGVLGAQWFNRMEWFMFADGARLSWQDMELIVTTGGAANEHLYGDVLADRMAGGKGDDTLTGGGGADTYIFNAGDGHDTIADGDTSFLGAGFLTIDEDPDVLQFGAGIRPEDITFGRNGTSVDLIIGNSGDRVTLSGQDDYIYTGVFGNLSTSRVELIRFADGTSWTWKDLNQRMIAAATTGGNDYTLGTSTDDIFSASAGDDVLDGGDGNDTYAFGRGSGHDVIRDHVDNVLDGDDDRLVFGAGVSLSDLQFSRDGDDLIITIKNTGDSVRIEREFTWSAWFTWNDVETFSFADGQQLTKADVQRLLLKGTSGDDTLVGFSSEDVLDGGAGNDILNGGDGSDTYVFGRGYGNDTIIESVGYVLLGDEDKLLFGPGITADDIQLSRTGNDLTISVKGTMDSITIVGQFNMSAWFTWNDVESFIFADGTVWSKNDVSAMLLRGSAGDDVMLGTSGNDYLNGGAGNDELRGGDGSDTYVFGRGYGHDSIFESVDYVLLGDDDQVVFNADVSQADLLYTRDGDNLIVRIAGTDDVLTIVGEFAYQAWFTWNDVERFVFADGSQLTKEEIRQKVLTGTVGDDHILGFASNDLIDGGAGNDILEGRDGSDTYRFGVGDGHDLVLESLDDGRSSEEDTLSFKDNVRVADVKVTREGQDAVFTLASGDTIRVQGQFNQNYNEFLSSNDVEHVVFADGTTWDKVEIERQALLGTETNGDDILLGSWYGQTYEGKGGNDEIHGDGGDDTYVYRPGDGDDVIFDDSGNDRLVFGVGITAADLVISGNPGDGSQIVIRFANRTGSIRIQGQWSGDTAINTIQFADGSTMSTEEIAAAFVRGQATSGNDTVWGTHSANILAGGAGDDTLYGNGGDDVYRFGRGDGNDTILDRGPEHWWGFEDGGNDRIEMGAGIRPEDIEVIEANPDDIILRIRDTGERLTILGQVSDGVRRIEEVRFADGSAWSADDVLIKALAPTAGDDIHYAGVGSAVLEGGAGNDTLTGSQSADLLDGGTGNDALYGRGGDDIYRFGRGDGVDTIDDRGPEHWWGFEDGGFDAVELRAGIAPEDLEVVQVGADDIALRIKGTSDQLTLSGQTSDSVRRIEEVRFANGTIWSFDDVRLRALAPTSGDDVRYAGYTAALLEGGAGNDTLYGSGGDDILDGGTGNDFLSGGSGGNDIYRFGRGDGVDTILDRGPEHWWGFDDGGFDVVELRAGVTAADILVVRSGDDLALRIRGTTDRLVMSGALNDPVRKIEEVRFADGTVWTYDDLIARSANTAPSIDQSSTIGGTILETRGMSGASAKDSTSGSVLFSDPDVGDVHTAMIVDVTTNGIGSGLPASSVTRSWLTLGSLVEGTAGASGTLPWTFAAADQAFDYLGDGQTVSLVYTIRLEDAGGAFVDQPVTVVVTGTNDRPSITTGTVTTGSFSEMSGVTGSGGPDYVGGTIRFSDLDLSDIHALSITGVAATGTVAGLPMSSVMLDWLTKGAVSEASNGNSGNAAWNFSAPDRAFDYLGNGQTVTITYQAALDDGHGGTVAQPITITVTGTNDAPVIASGTTAAASLSELASTAGSTANDTAAGTIRFTDPEAADTHNVSIASVTASGGTAGLPSNATMLGWLTKGSLVEANGSASGYVDWSFAAPDGAFDYLSAGQSTTLNYALRLSDDKGAVTTQNVTITVAGSNDAIVISSAGTTATGSVTEIASVTGSTSNDQAAGVIRYADLDIADVHSARVSSLNVSGTITGLPATSTLFNWITLTSTEPSGSTAGAVNWAFSAPDSALDYLSAGRSFTLTYTVRLTDGKGSTVDQVITLTVTGTNDLPLIVAGSITTAGITEIAATTGASTADTASGTIRFGDADAADVHTASISSVTATGVTSGLPANATLLAWLSKGTLTEQSGTTAGALPWSFSAADSAFDYLGAGQTATLTYVVQVSDGKGGTLSQNVVVTVTGTNDLPVIQSGTTASGALTEISGSTASTTNDVASGTLRFSDADAGTHTATVTGVSVSGTVAGLPTSQTLLTLLALGTTTEPSGSTAGSIGWTFTAADKTFDYLAQGETVTITYAVQIGDGQGGVTQPVVLTITGTNDAPVVAAGTTATGNVTELANTTGSTANDTSSGAIRFADPDLSNVHTVAIASVASSGVTGGLPNSATLLGWLTKGGTTEPNGTVAGTVPWSFAAPDASFDYLGSGQTATLTYVVQVTDSTGASFTQNVVITINGTNDAAVVLVPGAQIARTSTATRLSGVSINDVDANAGTQTATLTASLGSLTVTAATGATVTGSASSTLKVSGTIAQVNATLATLTYTGSSAGNDTISLSVNDGAQTTAKSIAVTTSANANHGPILDGSTTATGAITELASSFGSTTADTATGTIRFTDADVPDVHSVTVSSVAATGITSGLPTNATLLAFLGKGTVTEQTGNNPGAVTWTFSAPDKTFDYLGAGQIATLSYVVTVTDGNGGSVAQNVTITITGTNDGAAIASGSTTTGAITERSATLGSSTNDTASGSIAFTDEAGDTHTATITGVAASGTVTSLPANATMLAWLGIGALTEQSGTTAGTLPWSFAAPDSAFDYLSASQTATLTYTVRITDNLGATTNQNVVVTVTGSNDTPTAAAKAGYTTDTWTALTVTGATLLTGATDPDKADTLTLSTVQAAVGGTVALTNGNAVFTPNGTTTGAASFTYTISDGKGGTSTATAALTITLRQTNGTANADTITGTAGKKSQIDGLAGNDTITAGSAGDTIIGGAGADALTGAAGIDTFVYHSGFGKDTIASFTATGTSHDYIQIDKTLFADWTRLLGATKQVGSDLVITYDTSNTITLKNVALSNFTSADAIFV